MYMNQSPVKKISLLSFIFMLVFVSAGVLLSCSGKVAQKSDGEDIADADKSEADKEEVAKVEPDVGISEGDGDGDGDGTGDGDGDGKEEKITDESGKTEVSKPNGYYTGGTMKIITDETIQGTARAFLRTVEEDITMLVILEAQGVGNMGLPLTGKWSEGENPMLKASLEESTITCELTKAALLASPSTLVMDCESADKVPILVRDAVFDAAAGSDPLQQKIGGIYQGGQAQFGDEDDDDEAIAQFLVSAKGTDVQITLVTFSGNNATAIPLSGTYKADGDFGVAGVLVNGNQEIAINCTVDAAAIQASPPNLSMTCNDIGPDHANLTFMNFLKI